MPAAIRMLAGSTIHTKDVATSSAVPVAPSQPSTVGTSG